MYEKEAKLQAGENEFVCSPGTYFAVQDKHTMRKTTICSSAGFIGSTSSNVSNFMVVSFQWRETENRLKLIFLIVRLLSRSTNLQF